MRDIIFMQGLYWGKEYSQRVHQKPLGKYYPSSKGLSSIYLTTGLFTLGISICVPEAPAGKCSGKS